MKMVLLVVAVVAFLTAFGSFVTVVLSPIIIPPSELLSPEGLQGMYDRLETIGTVLWVSFSVGLAATSVLYITRIWESRRS